MPDLIDGPRRGRWPNLIIAGTQKAGTTWLHVQLDRHPGVFMSRPKELFYWGEPAWDTREAQNEYRAVFASADPDVRWRGESTASYFWTQIGDGGYSPRPRGDDPARAISHTLGDEVMVIVLLRDPVRRALAGAQHHLTMGRIDADADILEADPELGIVDLGFYRRHLEHWSSVLDPGQLLVYLFDDLVADPAELYRQVLSDLRLDPTALSDRQWALVPRVSNSRSELQQREGAAAEFVASPAVLERLADLYAEDIAFVEHWTGRNLDHWRSPR